MVAVAERRKELRGTDGFLVQTAEGRVGWVEEVWLDADDEPRALAVQTSDGRRALLLAEDVLAVDREYRWVVAPPHPALLELGAPHLVAGGADGGRFAASWATTGAVIEPVAQTQRLRLPRLRRAAPRERPLWVTVVALYASLAAVVALLIALAFVIARLVTGAAY